MNRFVCFDGYDWSHCFLLAPDTGVSEAVSMKEIFTFYDSGAYEAEV